MSIKVSGAIVSLLFFGCAAPVATTPAPTTVYGPLDQRLEPLGATRLSTNRPDETPITAKAPAGTATSPKTSEQAPAAATPPVGASDAAPSTGSPAPAAAPSAPAPAAPPSDGSSSAKTLTEPTPVPASTSAAAAPTPSKK